ncbi:MAG: CDP-alcohol phosphatidyltransferase family protein [Burkholderiales bacterium]|jgi:cardiolipin synthase
MTCVPNVITLMRLLLVPVIAVVLANHLYTAAFWLFLAAGLSDGLDGFIARRFNAVSATGALLDPVADKMVIMTCAFVLAWNGLLPLWLAVPLIARDALMLGVGFTDPRLKDGWLPPNFFGKVHAALAFLTLTLAIAQASGLFDVGRLLILFYLLLFASVWVSAALYFQAWQNRRRDVGETGNHA